MGLHGVCLAELHNTGDIMTSIKWAMLARAKTLSLLLVDPRGVNDFKMIKSVRLF